MMMKSAIFIFAMALLAVVAIAAVVFTNETTEMLPPELTISAISTDKVIYHSKESMNITISVFASKPAMAYRVTVEGIEDSRGRTRLSDEQTMNFTPGENVVVFAYTLPSCNTCSGIKAGNYTITAAVWDNDSVIANATHGISLQQ